MQLFSTKSPQKKVSLKEAVFHSLPTDGGLYMPEQLSKLPDEFIESLPQKSFQEIAYQVAKHLLGDSVDDLALKQIVEEAINFSAPVIEIEKDSYVLELFHGPTMAFKDFGARFMSRLMSYLLNGKAQDLHILVATSGDTGGAVAQGFYGVPGISVTILYPKGKVSPLQEKQLTTLRKNITAVEVEGTFDDCQALVKRAFLDEELKQKMNLSSANSINIIRLIPQTFYYFNAYAQIRRKGNQHPIVFSVPSGNFGNLTAGLFAEKMGLPVSCFIAATNVNAIVPEYLKTGMFTPKPSVQTLSNAMDIGNPSNFERMRFMFDDEVDKMRAKIKGYAFTDQETLEIIKHVEQEDDYILCPHTAIAYQALKNYGVSKSEQIAGVFLSSAHPCKFPNVYTAEQWQKITIPPQGEEVMHKEKQALTMKNDFQNFKDLLLNSIQVEVD